MRLASYSRNGLRTWGVVVPDGVVDARTSTGYESIAAMLAAGATERLARAAEGPVTPLSEIRWLPVIPKPANIFCIGHNYEEHRVETRRDPTKHPTVFLRNAASQIGHEAPLVRPLESTWLDFEGEIAVVIGKPGRRIPVDDAWGHVAGYAPYNDGSVRDWQRHSTQWSPGKNFEGTGAFGPWMTLRGSIADGEELVLETRVNGKVVQHASTQQLIFPIPVLIAYLSTFTTLQPGDVIVSGTPGGIGLTRNPPEFLQPGDVVEVEVSKVGVLRNTVQQELR